MPAQETYTVRPGDTLARIADQLQVAGGHQAIAQLNGITNPNLIRPGQTLRLPAGTGGDGEQAAGGGGGAAQTYTVRSGDSLARIAARFNYPGGYQALAAANGISNPNLLRVGQVLQVGGGGGQQETQPAADTQQPAQPGGDGGSGASEPQPETDTSPAVEVQPETETQGGDTQGAAAGGPQDAPIDGEQAWIDAAVRYNRGRGYSRDSWREIQTKIGTEADGSPGKMTARAAYRYQQANSLTADGQVGPGTLNSLGIEAQTGGGSGGNNPVPDTGPVSGLRARILEVARSSLSDRTGHNYYSQPGQTTYQLTPDKNARPKLRSDCSQWVRAVYHHAGVSGEPGTYTGAMEDASQWTDTPKPGDILLKGGRHVELFVGGDQTIGHGSPPINYGSVSYWRGQGLRFATYRFLGS